MVKKGEKRGELESQLREYEQSLRRQFAAPSPSEDDVLQTEVDILQIEDVVLQIEDVLQIEAVAPSVEEEVAIGV